jgi:hypothetical protein
MTRYTPPGKGRGRDRRRSGGLHDRPRWVRIGVWVLLVGVIALVLTDIVAVLVT